MAGLKAVERAPRLFGIRCIVWPLNRIASAVEVNTTAVMLVASGYDRRRYIY
jgi:hypothetical protein